jgi:hypothetical protein
VFRCPAATYGYDSLSWVSSSQARMLEFVLPIAQFAFVNFYSSESRSPLRNTGVNIGRGKADSRDYMYDIGPLSLKLRRKSLCVAYQ